MVSVFDLFKIGSGPSSSHTVGPMRAAAAFVASLRGAGLLDQVARVQAVLLGSLAWTGEGHDTDRAVILGLAGEVPDLVEADAADRLAAGSGSAASARSASTGRPTCCPIG